MKRSVVTFHYTLRDPKNQIIDTSEGGDPISYLEGAGHIIEGLESELKGAQVGEQKKVFVPAARAYGLRDEGQIQRVPRSVLPVQGELAIGDRFQAGSDQFAPIVMVVKIEGDDVWLDANHPLAGVDLVFDVQITGVREATSEEISQGRVHAQDGQGAF